MFKQFGKHHQQNYGENCGVTFADFLSDTKTSKTLGILKLAISSHVKPI